MKRIFGICLIMALPAAAFADSSWEGKVTVGGVVKDETGDRSIMQETYNIHEGASLSGLLLNGKWGERNYFRADVSNVNQPNRYGFAEYRVPGLVRLYSRYRQSQYVFDPSRATESDRINWYTSARYTPTGRFQINADYTLTNRTGDRIGYPGGVESQLGSTYDFKSHFGHIDGQYSHDYVGITVSLDASTLKDNDSELNDREGQVAAANLYFPQLGWKRMTHLVRGVAGRNELPNSNVKNTLTMANYTGVVMLRDDTRLKYQFNASRVDDEATDMLTDNYIHDVGATWFYGMGDISAGYAWEALDDDRSVTTYNSFRGSARYRSPDSRVRGSVSYAGRNKEDKEKLTLLKDSELARFKVKGDVKLTADMSVGATYANRNRKMPDVMTEVTGNLFSGYGRFYYEYFGDRVVESTATVNYTYADDEYTNITGGFATRSHVVTAALDVVYNENLAAGAAVTYMDVGQDLDIEKSILSFKLGYTIREKWDATAKYNVYNYDDFILIDRFYTANVVWLDIGYSFETGSE